MPDVKCLNKDCLGLIFTGGQGPNPAQCKAIVNQANAENQSVFIISADSGLSLAEQAEIKPHWIVGDMDSLDPRRLTAYPPDMITRVSIEKDHTDTELAINILNEKGCSRYWIIGGGGGRIDHILAIRALYDREPPPERWYTALEEIRCIETELSIKSGARPLEPVSVFPLGDGPWQAKSSGLFWPLDNFTWSKGLFGISNKALKGEFAIQVVKGRFLLVMPLEREKRKMKNEERLKK